MQMSVMENIKTSAYSKNLPIRTGFLLETSVCYVGQQGDLAGTLDSDRQLTLMGSAGTGGTAGQDLAALGQVTAKLHSVFEIDVRHLINAEGANLLALARMNTIIRHCHSESSYLGLVEKC
jgi:hypothetical protein